MLGPRCNGAFRLELAPLSLTLGHRAGVQTLYVVLRLSHRECREGGWVGNRERGLSRKVIRHQAISSE